MFSTNLREKKTSSKIQDYVELNPTFHSFFFFSLPQMPSERFLLYSWKILHYLSWLSFVSQGHFSFQVFVDFRKFLSFVD